MTTVHMSYLQNSTVNPFYRFADEENAVCEFIFDEVQILYFARPDCEGGRWCAYVGGMTLFRTHSFANLAMFLNSTMREEMGWCVLINCWIEHHE